MAKVQIEARVSRSGNGVKVLSDRVATNTARASYNFARRVEAGAKRRVPVRTGYLRNSIQRTKLGEGRHKVTVGARYGVYVEYGTRHMAPQPFFRPTVEIEKARFYEEMRKVFKP